MAGEIIEKSLLEVPNMAQVIIFYEINRFLFLTCYAFSRSLMFIRCRLAK